MTILQVLKKNKKFYYNKKHFTAVSGMLYRMKQNAAGLASICILSTMVLVVISMTVSMFAGIGDEHLGLLAKISEIIEDSERLEQLKTTKNVDEIMEMFK